MADETLERPSVHQVLQDTEDLFRPALLNRNDNSYIVKKLAAPRNVDDALRIRFLKRAAELLQALHSAVKFEQVSQPQSQSYDSSLLLALYKLLDFLVLEGVYPSLPAGIGLLAERRAKSLFYTKHDPAYLPVTGSDLLSLVVASVVGPILKDTDIGIEPLIRHRVLSDIVTGNACLAHYDGRATFTSQFSTYLEKLPSATLFASYTALLQASKVDWFRSIISEQLSVLPLRPNGVRSTIDFLAASHRPPEKQEGDNTATPSAGPTIALEALQQASKLLSSVPQAMSAEAYFAKIAPQLLAMLDARDETALRRAAAFVIGNGILGKRSIGSPGSIGWSLFVVPILEAINPSGAATTHKRKADSPDGHSVTTSLVSHDALERALRRLSGLVFSHPNPGLTGRLIRPLLLPLWALSNYRGISFVATETSKCAFSLLSHFLRLVGTPANLVLLADNILCKGMGHWTFAPSDSGGVVIRRLSQPALQLDDEADLEQEVSRIDRRIQSFSRLLTSSQISDEAIGSLFFHVFDKQSNDANDISKQPSTSLELLKRLSAAKLLQSLVENFAGRLTKDPDQVLRLVDQVLQQYLRGRRGSAPTAPSIPSLSSLANLVQRPEVDHVAQKASTDQDDSLMVALSLLNVLVVSTDTLSQPKNVAKRAAFRDLLDGIGRRVQQDEAVAMQIRTTLALLDSKASPYITSISNIDTETALDVQRTLTLITADIASDLPPIRRSALHALQALIKSPDALLDVPPLALLLLEVIRTDKEEFVYLAAVQTTVQLAVRRNLGYVARQLIDSFQDVEEQSGVDGRLRIGEALASIADELGTGDMEDTKNLDAVRNTSQSLLTVAGRRGRRQREQLARQREERLQRRKRGEAERAWGGEVPDVPMEDDGDDYEELSAAERRRRLHDLEVIESIVRGWEDTGYEEDVRVRASALSIVGLLFERCPQDPRGSRITSNTVELCMSILSLELEPAKAILRRAAALALFSILKGIDTQLEAGIVDGSPPLMNGEDWSKIEKVLRWVVGTDPDDLTVGHSETVLEGLEAVRMKVVAGAVESASQPKDLDGQLRGLTVNPIVKFEDVTNSPTSRRPVIEELE